jgi:uncharacterized Zn-binding protein involved in type VI secretion
MALQYAAHVDHPVSHTASTATIGLSLVGVALAAAVVIYSGGTALVVLGAASTGGSVGMNLGRIVDHFSAPSADAKIKSGLPTVLLGPQIKPAARADAEDSKVDCHDDKLAEGSKIVMIGEGMKPMSRRGDRTKCGGMIVDGIHSIIVGGDPSMMGVPISEEDSTAVKGLSLVLSLVGAGTQMASGGVANAVRGAAGFTAIGLDQAGYSDAANVLNATTVTKPDGVLSAVSSAKTLYDGGASMVNLTAPLVSGH